VKYDTWDASIRAKLAIDGPAIGDSIVNTGITRGGELRKNYSLNLASEIKVDVVKLSYRISYSGSVDLFIFV
jgi:hypothetical protein